MFEKCQDVVFLVQQDHEGYPLIKKICLADCTKFSREKQGRGAKIFDKSPPLAMLPMVILYLIFQRQFIEGIATTGGK